MFIYYRVFRTFEPHLLSNTNKKGINNYSFTVLHIIILRSYK